LGKIVEIQISKGKTVQTSEKECVKVEYSLKAMVEAEEEVAVAKAHLEGLVDAWLSSVTELEKLIEKASQAKPQKTSTEIQNAFPKELRELLEFSEFSEGFAIRPKQYLGSENFARVVEVVKGLGGQYISKGKESHFEVPCRA
jgi:hypothetical protein